MTGTTQSDNPASKSAATGYRLAVLSSPNDRDGAVALLSGFLGMTAIDAKTRLRHVPAVWPEVSSREHVQEAVDGLRRLGAKAVAVEAERVPDLRAARTWHHLRCPAEHLEIVSLSGDVEETIPWDDVAAIGVGRVAGLGHRAGGQLADVRFRRNLGIANVDLKPTEQGTEVWIALEGPSRMCRFEAEHMNYASLEDRLSAATTENLFLLFGDLIRNASRAVLTPSALRYRDSQGRELDPFPNSDAHRDQVLACWMAAVAGGAVSVRRDTTRPTAVSVPFGIMGGDRLYDAHKQLALEVEALRQLATETDSAVADTASARELLTRFRQLVRDHFRLEEEGGYLRTVTENSPQYAGAVDALRGQHVELEDRLDELLSAPIEDRGEVITAFLAALEGHEHAENRLVQAAADDDLSAGD